MLSLRIKSLFLPKRRVIPKEGRPSVLINESGFYSIILSLKLESAKKFKYWVTSQVLPSTRKYGQYELFENPNNHMFKMENETDHHCRVVQYIRRFYPEAIIIAGLGENQDTATKRTNSWKKGYMKGQPDIIIANYHNKYSGLCIEFKSPTYNYQVSEAQKEMQKRFHQNNYRFLISNDYDRTIACLNKRMSGVRIPRKFCSNAFYNKQTYKSHLSNFHKIPI